LSTCKGQDSNVGRRSWYNSTSDINAACPPDSDIMRHFISGTDCSHNFSYLDKMLDISRVDRGGIEINQARLKGDPITLFTMYFDVVGKERNSNSDGASRTEFSETRLMLSVIATHEGVGEATSNESELSPFTTESID